ncbi:hypothetical protein [Curtobacterium sp. MCBA15_013]|uniref:hypothetical protein n=1 Tax=Curtobacterium sp. MCBA15_013 TaxID=1898739 RepID=UPI001113E078|nr:hypothetical protein [Curtobacterium sp. MCBA15_013]
MSATDINPTNEEEGISTAELCYGLWHERWNPVWISEARAEAIIDLGVTPIDGDYDGYEVTADDYARIQSAVRNALWTRRRAERSVR